MRLPPPARRYSPISVMAPTSETVSRPNSSLERDEVVAEEIEYFFAVNGGWRAQNKLFFTTESQRHREIK